MVVALPKHEGVTVKCSVQDERFALKRRRVEEDQYVFSLSVGKDKIGEARRNSLEHRSDDGESSSLLSTDSFPDSVDENGRRIDVGGELCEREQRRGQPGSFQ